MAAVFVLQRWSLILIFRLLYQVLLLKIKKKHNNFNFGLKECGKTQNKKK
ncbi:hypothetical protein GCM10028868_31820 [Virgibacillus kimchii]